MRILNNKNFYFLSVLYTIGVQAIYAQDASNISTKTSNHDLQTTKNIENKLQKAKTTIKQDPKIKRLLDIKTKMDLDGEFSERYKIQLYSGNLGNANKTLEAAKEKFSQWESSLHFETPDFKIWIGNFRNKLEADRALIEIKKEFPKAFSLKPKKKQIVKRTEK